jgi:hypothetical protein
MAFFATGCGTMPEFSEEEKVAICEALMLAMGIQGAFEPTLHDAAGTAYAKVLSAAWNQTK